MHLHVYKEMLLLEEKKDDKYYIFIASQRKTYLYIYFQLE